jgi:hypothetical protein
VLQCQPGGHSQDCSRSKSESGGSPVAGVDAGALGGGGVAGTAGAAELDRTVRGGAVVVVERTVVDVVVGTVVATLAFAPTFALRTWVSSSDVAHAASSSIDGNTTVSMKRLTGQRYSCSVIRSANEAGCPAALLCYERVTRLAGSPSTAQAYYHTLRK